MRYLGQFANKRLKQQCSGFYMLLWQVHIYIKIRYLLHTSISYNEIDDNEYSLRTPVCMHACGNYLYNSGRSGSRIRRWQNNLSYPFILSRIMTIALCWKLITPQSHLLTVLQFDMAQMLPVPVVFLDIL